MLGIEGALMRRSSIVPYAGSLIAGLLVWQIIAWNVEHLVLPGPLSTLSELPLLITEATTIRALAGTITAMLAGFGLAISVGIPLGFALGINRSLAIAVEPIINAIYAIPPVAMVPFLIIWFGLFLKARIALIFLMAVFEYLITVWTGVRSIDRRLIDVARSFGAGPSALLAEVIMPATLPFCMTALRIGFVRALNGAVTAELLFAAANIGALMEGDANHFDISGLLALIVIVSLFGLLVQEGMKLSEACVLPWHRQNGAR